LSSEISDDERASFYAVAHALTPNSVIGMGDQIETGLVSGIGVALIYFLLQRLIALQSEVLPNQ
jgi:hypothetical protein